MRFAQGHLWRAHPVRTPFRSTGSGLDGRIAKAYMGFFQAIGTWFGYVGSCVIAPDATCRPFLAFLALGVAATAALTLVIIAYRSRYARESAPVEERRTPLRTREMQERARGIRGQSVAPKPALQGRLGVAA
jgi:hypothetical protein